MKQQLVGLSGFAGAGKSETAKELESRGFVRLRFAGPIKAMLRALLEEFCLDHETIDRMIDGDLKEVPCPLLGGKTPRYAMQTLGTEWGRGLISDSLWVDATMESARSTLGWDSDASVVIDDVRFPNEVAAIQANGGRVILLERNGVVQQSGHASEAQIASLNVNAIVPNNGPIEDTADAVLATLPKEQAVEDVQAIEADAAEAAIPTTEVISHTHERAPQSEVKDMTIAGLEAAIEFAKSNDPVAAIVVVATPGNAPGEYVTHGFKSMGSELARDLVEEVIAGIDAANATQSAAAN